MSTPKHSYLGAMPQDERVVAAVLSLKATGTLPDIVAGGPLQFLHVARKPLSNFGLKQSDFDLLWDAMVAAVRDPAGFDRLVRRIQRRKRESIH